MSHNPQHKEDATPIINLGVKMALKDAPSANSSESSQKPVSHNGTTRTNEASISDTPTPPIAPPTKQDVPHLNQSPQLGSEEVNMEQIIRLVLAPIASKLEQVAQTQQQFAQVQQQLAQKQQHMAQAQQILVSSYKALQANMETMQDQLEQNKQDRSLQSLAVMNEPEHISSITSQPKGFHIPQSSHDSHKLAEVSHNEFTPKLESPQPVIMSPMSPSPTGLSSHSHQVRYPFDLGSIIQTVKPFDGSTENYSLFITRFDSLVHANPNIDTVMKQNILISLLEGDAKDLITSDELNDWSYQNLRNNLERVYNRQNDRRQQLMEGYRKLSFHQTDHDQMDKDVMKHICLTNSLQKTGVDVNNQFIIDTFVEKLPTFILTSVVKATDAHSMTFMDTANLVQKLITQQRMVHLAEQRKKERTQTNEVYVTEVNTNTTAAKTSGVHLNRTSIRQNYTPSPRPVWRATPCAFCSTNHATSDCPLSIAQKRAAIEKLGCCQNCLRKNHKVERCKSKFACYTCKRKHHSLICPEREKLDAIHSIKCPRPISRPHKNGKPQWPDQHNQKYQQTPIDTITINLSLVLDPDYKLPFLQLRTPSGALVNALIDSGATTSIMSKLAVQRLRCPIHQNKLVNFKGFLSSTGPQRINFHRLDILDNSGKVWNTIIPEFDHLPTTIKAPIFTTEDTSFLRPNNIDPKALMGLKRFDGKPIDMIIGNNILANILATSTRHILPSGRIVEETSLGYITHPSPVPDALRYAALPATQISDSVESSYVNHIDSDHPLTESDATAASITDSLLDKLLEQSWRLEVLGIEPPTIVKGKQLLNEELVTKFKQSAVLDPDNYIYVQFPFNGKEANLNDNYLVAVSRLVSLVNKQLERPTDRTSYNDIIQQQLSAGIIEPVPDSEKQIGPHYYIPHKVIIKPDSQTTKLRIVLDASSHMKHEMSLNDCIHAGPSILKSILGILLRARTTPYLMIADIEKAFHQVRVQSHHRNVTKFLWLKTHIEMKSKHYS
uniref:Copper-fist domain-containing protein n=1 Tax=Caenorhabditis japonica TaxID=281687 RepID=A0A8R1DZL4_CAEJA